MRVYRKTDYALRALFTLVDQPTLADVARRLPVSKQKVFTGFIGGGRYLKIFSFDS